GPARWQRWIRRRPRIGPRSRRLEPVRAGATRPWPRQESAHQPWRHLRLSSARPPSTMSTLDAWRSHPSRHAWTNCAARVVSDDHARSATSASSTNRLPTPTPAQPRAAYTRVAATSTPPVGTSGTSLSGAETALTYRGPPTVSMGNTLIAAAPARHAASISVGVSAPQTTGTPADAADASTGALVVGVTRNWAPDAAARSTSAAVRTDPTPMSASARSRHRATVDNASGVPIVISIRLIPPATSDSRMPSLAACSRSRTIAITPSVTSPSQPADGHDNSGPT